MSVLRKTKFMLILLSYIHTLTKKKIMKSNASVFATVNLYLFTVIQFNFGLNSKLTLAISYTLVVCLKNVYSELELHCVNIVRHVISDINLLAVKSLKKN